MQTLENTVKPFPEHTDALASPLHPWSPPPPPPPPREQRCPCPLASSHGYVLLLSSEIIDKHALQLAYVACSSAEKQMCKNGKVQFQADALDFSERRGRVLVLLPWQ